MEVITDAPTDGYTLKLTDEERAVLADVVQTSLGNLKEEVYKTENYDWRKALKSRELLLRGILERLAVPVT
jgi:hypothetical protein